MEEEDSEMVKQSQLVYATETDAEKVTNKSNHRVFRRSPVADKSRGSRQFAKTQSGIM